MNRAIGGMIRPISFFVSFPERITNGGHYHGKQVCMQEYVTALEKLTAQERQARMFDFE